MGSRRAVWWATLVDRQRVAWWATFAVAALVGAAWALALPPSGGPDEQAHLTKAAAVARGDLTNRVVWQEAWPGFTPITPVEVPAGYDKLSMWAQLRCWSGVPLQPTDCAPPLATSTGPIMATDTYVGAYQPAYYAAVGWPTRLFPPSRGVYVARLASVALCAALIASATASARRIGTTTTAAAVLTVPAAVVYIAATVNPQGPEILAAVSLWTTGLAVLGLTAPDKRLLLRLGFAVTVLATARPTGPALTAAIVMVIALAAADRESLRRLAQRRSARLVAAAVAVIWLANLVFVLTAESLSSVMKSSRPDGVTDELFRQVYDRLPVFATDQVGLLSWQGWVTLNLPRPLVDVWLYAIAALVLVAMVRGAARTRLLLVAMVVGCAVLPLVALYSQPEVAWQGRYALPLAVGIPVLSGWMIDRRGIRGAWASVSAAVLALCALLSAAALLVGHQQVMSRNLYGQPSAIFSPRDDSRWVGPLTPNLLFALALAASAGVCVLGAVGAVRALRGTRGLSGSRGPESPPAGMVVEGAAPR